MAEKVCPVCGHTYKVPDWLADSAKCPKCSGAVSGGEKKQVPDQPKQSPHDVFNRKRAADRPESHASASGPQTPRTTGVDSRTDNNRWFLLQSLINDARLRSLIAGAIGGLVGWILAEIMVGGPVGFGSTLAVGFLVGLGIAALIGVSEGAAIGSWDRARRGLAIGACLGALGGAIGANFGQLTYQVTNQPNSSVASGNRGSFIRPTFSPEVAERIAREGGEAGEIEIALIWENSNDLDLHVVDPSGVEIYYGKKKSHTGGWLDIDQNAGCVRSNYKPIEHVRWREGQVPEGPFVVYVNHFSNCGSKDPTPYRVEVKNGPKVQSFAGQTSYGSYKKRIHAFARGKNTSGLPNTTVASGTAPVFGLIGVVLGWVFFGAAVGCAEGLTRKSGIALRNAVLGGAVGGGVGGVLLLLLAGMQPDTGVMTVHSGWPARLIGFVILGAAIGFFMVVVERALSAALVVRDGQYEGREIFLDKSEMRIGRNDALEIYLGGDSGIANHHATIVKAPASHDIQSVEGTVAVGGRTASKISLNDGDVITLGSTQLTYKQKKQRLSDR